MRFVRATIQQLLPFVALIALWEFSAAQSAKIRFLFASPSSITMVLIRGLSSLELIKHILVTGAEAVIGMLLGVLVGSAIGFALLFSPFATRLARPYIVALSALPIFAIAPMFIIWFGIGFQMKVAMSFFSTVLVALSQAYAGGKNVNPSLNDLFKMHNSSNSSLFRKLILPSSLSWVLSSLKMSVGLSLLGAFIGEFIASEEGLGHLILKASGIYDVPGVLAAVVCIVGLAFFLNMLVSQIEKRQNWLIEAISVPKSLRKYKALN